MTYVIALPCVDVKDRACVDECPVDCIYEGSRMLYIQPDECVDCGACEPVCPVEAIFYEDDTPDEWADYYKANVEFFDELGAPGGDRPRCARLAPWTGQQAAPAMPRRTRRSCGRWTPQDCLRRAASGRSPAGSVARGSARSTWSD